MMKKVSRILLVGLVVPLVLAASDFLHRYFVEGLNTILGSVFLYGILLGFALFVWWGIRRQQEEVGFTIVDWFLSGCVAWLVECVYWYRGPTVDIQVHDTLFVIRSEEHTS